jgi:tRNA nucleotidyltransferase (CCA-adding enzyme)
MSMSKSMPNPEYWRQQFLSQDPVLVQAITRLAEAILAVPADDAYAPVTPQLVIVGGYVRDLILGKQPKDVDVEVYGVAPEKLQHMIRQLFLQVNDVGQSFGILKIKLEAGFEIDVALPRRETKVGTGHKGFVIESDPGLSFREAARRRDFTFNAIALDPLSGVIYDPYAGLTDLHNECLRVVDRVSFQEDPLRVFRAVQLSARLQARPEPDTFVLMKAMVDRGDLDQLSEERITDEWKKLLLKAKQPARGLQLLAELGVITKYYPELEALASTLQEPEWHPEGNVWIHTNLVVDQAARLIRQSHRRFTTEEALTVMLGALCHDFGKPLVTKVEDGRIRSKGHEAAGEIPVRAFLNKFTFGHDMIDRVVKITQDHLKTTQYWKSLDKGEVDERQYVNILRRLLRRLEGVSYEVFLAVTEADKRGRAFPDAETAAYPEGDVFREMLKKYDIESQARHTLVTGAEIIDHFGLAPGPKIGELIQLVENARDEGHIQDKQQALAFLQNVIYKL